MDLQVFLAISATVTKAVDFVRNAVDQQGKAPKWIWNLLAFAFGEVIVYTSSLNALNVISGGKILTGLAIGASASGFHEVFDFFSSKASAAKSVSGAPIEPESPKGV